MLRIYYIELRLNTNSKIFEIFELVYRGERQSIISKSSSRRFKESDCGIHFTYQSAVSIRAFCSLVKILYVYLLMP